MSGVLRTCVIAFLLAVLEYKQSDAFGCVWCASKNLKLQWQLTGLLLPSTASSDPNFFTDICDGPINATLTPKQSCSDFCFSMYIAPVNPDGTATPGQTLWIRGCHKDFTNALVPTSGNMDKQKCEYGTITRYTNATQAVNTPAGYAWCNVDAAPPLTACNKQSQTDFDTTCLQNPTVTCYDCVDGSLVKPCTTGATGSSSYCYKSDLWVNSQRFVTRSKSSINPLYPGATGVPGSATQPTTYQGSCGQVFASTLINTRATVSVSGVDCYCSTSDYCNGAATLAFSGVALVILIFVVFVTKL